MSDEATAPPSPPPAPVAVPRKRLRGRMTFLVLCLLLTYFAVAYLLIPGLWIRHFRRHPALDDTPGITTTSAGIPGDPVNVGLVGTEAEINQIMQAANWYLADPLSLRNNVKIAAATVLKRPYEEAPVSKLFLYGRKEDLAFEQAFGPDPSRRHHVRFWKSERLDWDGRPLWAGAATFDKSVGFSRTTGQITHHIEGDVDVERNHLFGDLAQTGELSENYQLDDFHKVRSGRNGGGDAWTTDGRLFVGVIRLGIAAK